MLAIAGALLGLIAGSFIATLTERWPGGRTISGRSHCETCHAPLTHIDLVPILSWLILRGACRRCKAPIGARGPVIEVAALLIGLIGLCTVPGPMGLAGAFFGWVLLALAILDIEHFWLPDRLTLPLLGLGLLIAALAQTPVLRDHVIGALAGFLFLSLIRKAYSMIRKREGLGGGDPKLFGAIGAWLGWQVLPLVLLLACGIGLVVLGLGRLVGRSVRADQMVPLGSLLAVAAFPLWLLLHSPGRLISLRQLFPGSL